ncbi:MAG: cupin domain-containing protein [Nitrososphaerota archaeon]|jgi:quercetin dioxygenase-like cupin family protein|nr:cupin domain-containing protein [Nitrososphaerota archaeon]MDG6930097.1 cupin domain-containing protein [Nitrososphaerota archaeon]
MDHYKSNISEVKKETVQVNGSKGAYIQWLITRENGAHYAVRKFTVEPSGIIPMHTHKYQETVVITKGKCKLCVANRVYEMKDNDYVFIDGDIKHAILNHDERLEFFCIIDYAGNMEIQATGEEC